MKKYKTARHPKTKKLWIVGYCGGGYYMAIKQVDNEAVANQEIKYLLMAEESQKRELATWNMK